jgi:hypothetical protein
MEHPVFPGEIDGLLIECSPVVALRDILFRGEVVKAGTRGVLLTDASNDRSSWWAAFEDCTADGVCVVEADVEDLGLRLESATGQTHLLWWLVENTSKKQDPRLYDGGPPYDSYLDGEPENVCPNFKSHGAWELDGFVFSPTEWVRVYPGEEDQNDIRANLVVPSLKPGIDSTEALRRICLHVASLNQ